MSENNNFNFHADHQQNQIGDNNVQKMNFPKNKVFTAEEFLDFVEAEIKDKGITWKDIGQPEDLAYEYDSPEEFVMQAKSELHDEAVFKGLTENEVETNKVEWYEKFRKFLPHFVKGAAEVGVAIAKTYKDSSPVIAGFIAAFDYIRKNS